MGDVGKGCWMVVLGVWKGWWGWIGASHPPPNLPPGRGEGLNWGGVVDR